MVMIRYSNVNQPIDFYSMPNVFQSIPLSRYGGVFFYYANNAIAELQRIPLQRIAELQRIV